jgi:hypothetical protein
VNLAGGYTYYMTGSGAISCSCNYYSVGTINPSTGAIVIASNCSYNGNDYCIAPYARAFGTSTQSNGTSFFLTTFQNGNCQSNFLYGDPVKVGIGTSCLPTYSCLQCFCLSTWPYALAIGCNCAIAFGSNQYAWYCAGSWGNSCCCCFAMTAGEGTIISAGFFGNGVAFVVGNVKVPGAVKGQPLRPGEPTGKPHRNPVRSHP